MDTITKEGYRVLNELVGLLRLCSITSKQRLTILQRTTTLAKLLIEREKKGEKK